VLDQDELDRCIRPVHSESLASGTANRRAERGDRVRHRADALVHGGVRGIVPGHQLGELRVPASQRVEGFDALEEPLPVARVFTPRAARSRSRMKTWLRSIGLGVSPRARCRPVRTCSASGSASWTALT
jgi:hypothetical protein